MTSVQWPATMLEHVEAARASLRDRLKNQQKLEQYFTSAPLADLMASMMTYSRREVSILDPGAGVGSLFAACIDRICSMPDGSRRPHRVSVTAYEIDEDLSNCLVESLEMAQKRCTDGGIYFSYVLKNKDFVAEYCTASDKDRRKFTHIIINPPYGKINVKSDTYAILRSAGLPATNTYAAFVGISTQMMRDGGQMVFISPRSFCNGAYFHQFRKTLLESTSLKRIHLFNSRSSSFIDDGVLQENVIVYSCRNPVPGGTIISASGGPGEDVIRRTAKRSEVVFRDDPDMFIHIVPDKDGTDISRKMRSMPCTLGDLDMDVSTGKIVDFRMKDELRFDEEEGTVPLVRPFNICDGAICFPIRHKKHCNFIMANEKSERLLVCNGIYILVKRFTTIEQNKRIMASVWTGEKSASDLVGFENRINYFHSNGGSIDPCMAEGLRVFLNSTPVDTYFRQFNGSTQVNASDLRYLRYPSASQLRTLGDMAEQNMSQDSLDGMVEDVLFGENKEP